MEIELTKDNFETEVIKSDMPVLVDFWAEWCGPCQAIAPILAEIAEEYQGKINIGKLNVDHHSSVAQQYQIASIPNLKIFSNGQIVDEIIGIAPKEELKNRINKVIKAAS